MNDRADLDAFKALAQLGLIDLVAIGESGEPSYKIAPARLIQIRRRHSPLEGPGSRPPLEPPPAK